MGRVQSRLIHKSGDLSYLIKFQFLRGWRMGSDDTRN